MNIEEENDLGIEDMSIAEQVEQGEELIVNKGTALYLIGNFVRSLCFYSQELISLQY